MTMKRYELIAQAIEQTPAEAVRTLIDQGALSPCYLRYPEICKEYERLRSEGIRPMAAIRIVAIRFELTEGYARNVVARYTRNAHN